MAIAPKTSRTTLKTYFKKNAIPKESDFAELIDAAINQGDDGIAKPDGEPLSLQPDARDSGSRTVLGLYKSFADARPAWTLSLSPAGKPGFSIGDADASSRLFVDETTGNVGLGTVTPASSLHLGRSVAAGLGPVLTLTNGAGGAGAGAAIDFSGYDTQGRAATARIQSLDDGNFSSHLVFSTKRPGANTNALVEALRITPSSAVRVATSLGIGLRPNAEPRTALDTGLGVLSGAANDYQKAQATLSGGGTITWEGSGGFLRWSSRLIAICAERGNTFSVGWVNIVCPTDPTLVTSFDRTNRVNAARGILLNVWEALYAVHEVGQDANKVTFQIVAHNLGTYQAPSNWLLVAVTNGDDNTIKMGSGVTVAASSSYSSAAGSSLPRGAIIMWTGATAPAGWALCDGQNGTPDLRGRFVLGTGAGTNLTARPLNQTGGKESHALSISEMPKHAHGVSDPGHAHSWSATRQQAGTDDNNNTRELSRGDRGVADIMTKDTDQRGTGIAIQAEGGNAAHENMPPFWVLAYIMKL
jgi:microcystin-dependent protein